MKNKSFSIYWQNVIANAAEVNFDESNLWHKRYGHYNFKCLAYLHFQGLVRDFPEINEPGGVCESCNYGKMHREAFPTGEVWRATQKLQLVHIDICGPMRKPSLSQNLYFVLFIDDCTRMCRLYSMKNKSDVFHIFKKFKALVEGQSGYKIQILRSDNGKEYTSKMFDKFCEENGVYHQLSVAYTLHQNGVAERKNRSMMKMARSMMAKKNLPKKFCAEAVYTSVYLQNRLATKAVKGKTPIEVFGSLCYIHVPDHKRGKLDNKAVKENFLGYSSQSKGCRVYNLETESIAVSKDIKVDDMLSGSGKKLNHRNLQSQCL